MPFEIERRFLVNGWIAPKHCMTIYDIEQGYLSLDPVVRVRISKRFMLLDGNAIQQENDDAIQYENDEHFWNEGYITVKGKKIKSKAPEYEYRIPVTEAYEMLAMCEFSLKKRRFNQDFDGKLWEIDVFEGNNEGLIIAEIETNTEDENINLPPWIGKEITEDYKYSNVELARNPYKNWC